MQELNIWLIDHKNNSIQIYQNNLSSMESIEYSLQLHNPPIPSQQGHCIQDNHEEALPGI